VLAELFLLAVGQPLHFVLVREVRSRPEPAERTFERCSPVPEPQERCRLEPEWEGHVTLEFSNTTTLPAKIYANEGVAQMLFLQSDEACEVSYKDRGGKYQGQLGVTLPRA
jgi:deoxycytidine triphosphate deaminase